MNRLVARLRLILVLGVGALSASGLAGCATKGQTAAATAGGLLGVGLVGIPALTNSKLEVTVDMYSPTDEVQRTEMRLNRPTALMQWINDRRQADNMVTAWVNLRSVMPTLEKNIATLGRSINQLRGLDGDPYKNVMATLDGQRQAAAGTVDAWKEFDTTLSANIQRIDEPTVFRTLVVKLVTLRERADPKKRFEAVTQDYLDFLRTQLGAAFLADIDKANLANKAEVTGKVIAEMRGIKDDPAATVAERIAAILDAVRRLLAFVPGDHVKVDSILSAFVFFNSQQLIAMDSREAIVTSLTAPPPSTCDVASATPVAGEDPALLPGRQATNVNRCIVLAHSYTLPSYSRATSDVNMGPISNEVQQVLQAASRSLSVISDPANADRWRLGTAYAKSDGGQGNHNSIIYFENMGLPVVKSSAFDPTKFVVAQGALYRQVFSAAVAAFGAPLPTTAGTAGATDMQSSNVIAIRARIRNAEKAAAAVRQKVLDTLKTAIDEQKKVKSGDWKKNKATIVKEAQDALQKAASQLEAVAGSN